ncbi:flavocytochrome c [Spirochaetia bacterium]|nr:flavocytochrome c [Spirochaetia bacterium]
MNVRKIVSVLLVLALGFAVLAGCQTAGGKRTITAGTYTAVSHGFYGDFDVTVTVSDTAITAITTGPYKETEALGGKAIKLLTENIIAANTAGVDGISGATITSAAFRAAVRDALTQAGASSAFTAPPTKAAVANQTLTTDVLVIGAGAAGFSAAITAAQGGAKVTIIEKQDIVGGSTVTSAGIVYAALDPSDYTKMADYYMARAEGNANRELLQYFAEHSLETIQFLEDAGVKWLFSAPAGTAPEPRARFSTHENGPAMIGSSLINPLEAKALSLGVTILTGVRGTELIQNSSGVITGAKATSKQGNYTITARAVVLATGGFDASDELIAKYSPIAAGDIPLSSKGNTGDGIIMGIAAGAATEFKGGIIGFEFVDSRLPDSGNNAAAMGAPLFVKGDGTFIAPAGDYPINYTALKKAGGRDFFGIYDSTPGFDGSDGAAGAKLAISQGFGCSGNTIEELAAASGMDAAKLTAAIGQVRSLTTAPYYAVVVKPTSIGSMGGLRTNAAAEVLRDGTLSPIPGLYAAGEVANGGFYNIEYPASGSSNSLAFTFGRAAGTNAAIYIAK